MPLAPPAKEWNAIKLSISCDDLRTVHSAPVSYKLPVNTKYWDEILIIIHIQDDFHLGHLKSSTQWCIL